MKIILMIFFMLAVDKVYGGLLMHKPEIDVAGCYHNGTLFADGSLVPTLEPCLNCKCTSKTLICSLRVCPEVPALPPRGCVLVHKKNGCCPYLSCPKYQNFSNILNRRIAAYLDEAERESIDRVVSENVLQKRSDDSDLDGYGEICVKNGTVYKSGSAMSSSSQCSYCYCIGGVQRCVKPKCLLSMVGCQPIFVDSACCPVRYDCTSKSSAFFKSQNTKRRTGNKHYLRMATRLQKAKRCIHNSTFYPEGHKLPSDPDRPCDICFCIRGARICSPKKCAPAIRNCLPVVPKGQCCPSSYDCSYTKEMARAHQSQGRQFDFFSILFGSDESSSSLAPPTADWNQYTPAIKPTSEKSFLDAIREGLEFIDSNNSELGDEVGDKNELSQGPSKINSSSTDHNLGLLNILLDAVTSDSDKIENILITEKDAGLENFSSTQINEDLLATTNIDESSTRAQEDTTVNFSEETTPYDYDYAISEEPEYFSTALSSDYGTNYDFADVADTMESQTASTILDTTTHSSGTYFTINNANYSSKGNFIENKNTNNKDDKIYPTYAAANIQSHEVDSTNTSIGIDLHKNSSTYTKIFTQSTTMLPEKIVHHFENISKILTTPNKTEETQELEAQGSSENLLSVLISGLSNIFKEDNSTIIADANKNNQSIVNVTEIPNSLIVDIKNFSMKTNQTDAKQNSTENSIIIKTNPSILESDLNLDYIDPTLPPSLPNLKIIPFLPTDAVKNNRKQVNYDFYKVRPTVHPSITEGQKPWNLLTRNSNSDIGYDTYDGTAYPSITENYPSFGDIGSYDSAYVDYENNDPEIVERHKYLGEYPYIKRKYDIGPSIEKTINAPVFDKFVTTFTEKSPFGMAVAVTASPGYGLQINRFSPPTKTEGGFLPKSPVHDHLYYDSFHATHKIVDITTDTPRPTQNNTNQISIGVSPIDPFRDVIKTEPPPNLNSLIEDKEKFILNRKKGTLYESSNEIIKEMTPTLNITNLTQFNYDNNNTNLQIEKIHQNFMTSEFKDKIQAIKNESEVILRENFKPLNIPSNLNETTNNKNFNFDSVLSYLFGDEYNITALTTTTKPTTSLNKQLLNSEFNSPNFESVTPPNNSSKNVTPISAGITTTTITTSTPSPILTSTKTNAMNNIFSEPFNNFPYLNPSFPIREIGKSEENYHYSSLSTDLDLIYPELSKNYDSGLNDLIKIDLDNLKHHQSDGDAEIITKPDNINSLNDPAGILKLAGCNIYGRMYRVGKIISELSGPCLECKCTEIGVNCTPLEC